MSLLHALGAVHNHKFASLLMSSSASVEIWHIILKHAIHVPIFFEDDPVDAYGVYILQQYSYEAPYWHAERIRNSLRRVCRTWGHFLSPFAHRFVRLDDVLHRRVPATALPLALRLDLDTSPHCECAENCNSETEAGFWGKMKQIWDAAPFACGEDGNTMTPIAWRVEIIKGWIADEKKHYSILRERAPGLKVMLSQPPGALQSGSDLPNLLRLLSTDLDYEQEWPLSLLSGAASLTVLHVMVENLNFLQNNCTLPSLKHLSVQLIGDRDTASQKELFHLLGTIGSQLSTFHFRHREDLGSSQVEHDLWRVLPVVESIELPYKWSGAKVPQGHPLRQIRIDVSTLTIKFLSLGNWGYHVVPYLPVSGDDRRTVRMNRTWNEELFSYPQLALSIEDHYQIRGIPFIDAHGHTFSQHVVFLIAAFWKQPDRKYHKSMRELESPILEF